MGQMAGNPATGEAPAPSPLDKKLSAGDKKLADDLAGVYGLIGMLVSSFAPLDGMIIMQGASARAREVVAVAKHHPAMRRWLIKAVASNDYVLLATGHAGMVFAIAAVHGYTPQRILGAITGANRREGQQAQAPRPAGPMPGAFADAHAAPPADADAQAMADAAAQIDAQRAVLQAMAQSRETVNGFNPLALAGIGGMG